MTFATKWLRSSPIFALVLQVSALQAQPNIAPRQPAQEEGRAAAPAAPAAAPEVIAAAACVLGRNAAAADALFATAAYSAAEREQAVRLLPEMRRCSHRPQMVSSAAMIRGGFAEAALETIFPTPQAPRTPPFAAAPLPRGTEGDAAFLAQIAPMYQLADCAIPRQPELARAVLATDPGGSAESAAITALNPTFIACVPAGSQLRIDRRIMRFLLAEALYRWSAVQRDGASSPWAAH
jgi:hypothetical protein